MLSPTFQPARSLLKAARCSMLPDGPLAIAAIGLAKSHRPSLVNDPKESKLPVAGLQGPIVEVMAFDTSASTGRIEIDGPIVGFIRLSSLAAASASGTVRYGGLSDGGLETVEVCGLERNVRHCPSWETLPLDSSPGFLSNVHTLFSTSYNACPK